MRNEKQEEDRKKLEKRRRKIAEAIGSLDWQMHVSRSGINEAEVDYQFEITRICQLATVHFRDNAATAKVCKRWRDEMADMIAQMHSYWTRIEQSSLCTLLIHFEYLLELLLYPLPELSVFDPGARQPAADHQQVIDHFVSGAVYITLLEAETDGCSVTNHTGALERGEHQKSGGQLLPRAKPVWKQLIKGYLTVWTCVALLCNRLSL